MALSVFTAFLIVLLPAISIFLVKKYSVFKKLSPVFICYTTGIALANTPCINFNGKLVSSLYEASVLLAIPMLLFNVKLSSWPQVAKASLLSFLFATLAALIGCFTVSFLFMELHNVANLSGMLVGIFVGGTANMQAVGIALGVSNAEFIKLNVAEVACCGIYLLFLVSIAKGILSRILPAYKNRIATTQSEELIDEPDYFIPVDKKFNKISILSNFGLAIVIIALAAGITYLLTSTFNNASWIIILITSLSIAASNIKWVHKLRGGYETAEYLLLMFCTGIGLMADFSLIIKDGLEILMFVTTILLVIFIIHLLLCYLFNIDTDNMIISSTATIFGPAFIGQVAASIKNKEIIFPGMVISMIGIAIANYLGIGMAYLLEALILN